jgi:tetratricopeptide (TPR) repeat protein
MLRLCFFLFVFLTLAVSQDNQFEVVRFSPEKESWLNRNIDETFKLILSQAESTDVGAVTFYNLGYLSYLRGKNSRALNFFQKAVDKDSSYPYPYLITAQIYEESGNLLGALSQIRRGLAKDNENYDLLLEEGSIYYLLGEIDEAEEIFLQLIDSSEDKTDPRIALSRIYRNRGEFDKALMILGDEKEIYPESELLLEKAHIHREAGRENVARDILIRLYQEYPYASKIQAYRDTLQMKYGVESVNPNPVPRKFRYKIQPEESLDYTVKYGFITLGWLNVRMLPAEIINGRKVYPIRFFVNSNPAFGFLISLHHIYESYIDAETMNATQTRLYTPGSDEYLARIYYFDYEYSRFVAHIIYSDGRFHRIEKLLPQMAQDGTSVLYFARGLVSNKMNGTTTVVIDEQYKYALITYLNEREEIDIGDHDINTIKVFAHLVFEGIAGMNGDAWGWFSPDEQFVPLMGKFKIIVGSISVKMDSSNSNVSKEGE